MQALLMRGYGRTNAVVSLGDVPKPVPHSGELLIQVHAAGLNPLDYKIRQGAMRAVRRFPLPAIMGNEAAGVVTALGKGVAGFQVGDQVMVRVDKDRLGAFAEFIACEAGLVALKPRTASMVEAASLPLAGLTAWQSLHEVLKIGPGTRLLIPAGAGGVGSLAIQLAKLAGAWVATTASGKGLAMARDLGADLVVDYKNETLKSRVQNLDAVFDTLGGDSLSEAFKLLRPGGAVCSVAAIPEPTTADAMGAGPLLKVAFWLMSRKVRAEAARCQVSYRYLFMRPDGAQLQHLAKLMDEGKLKAVIDRTYHLAAGIEALDYLETGRAKGKVVLQVIP